MTLLSGLVEEETSTLALINPNIVVSFRKSLGLFSSLHDAVDFMSYYGVADRVTQGLLNDFVI